LWTSWWLSTGPVASAIGVAAVQRAITIIINVVATGLTLSFTASSTATVYLASLALGAVHSAAILINTVATNVKRAREDVDIAIVAIQRTAISAFRGEAVPITIGTNWGGPTIRVVYVDQTITIVVYSIRANLEGTGIDLGIIVVAVDVTGIAVAVCILWKRVTRRIRGAEIAQITVGVSTLGFRRSTPVRSVAQRATLVRVGIGSLTESIYVVTKRTPGFRNADG
jgi:hypothetical protein